MSSYLVDPINPDHEIWIGWDPMLNTYFAHIIDTSKDEDDPERDLLWIGTRPSEVHDVQLIYKAVKGYTEHDGEDMLTNLYRDANT